MDSELKITASTNTTKNRVHIYSFVRNVLILKNRVYTYPYGIFPLFNMLACHLPENCPNEYINLHYLHYKWPSDILYNLHNCTKQNSRINLIQITPEPPQ